MLACSLYTDSRLQGCDNAAVPNDLDAVRDRTVRRTPQRFRDCCNARIRWDADGFLSRVTGVSEPRAVGLQNSLHRKGNFGCVRARRAVLIEIEIEIEIAIAIEILASNRVSGRDLKKRGYVRCSQS
jgi:hypothetical protein